VSPIVLAVLITVDAEDRVQHLRLPPSVAESLVSAGRARREVQSGAVRSAEATPVPEDAPDLSVALSPAKEDSR
jgi:hypothetical protein